MLSEIYLTMDAKRRMSIPTKYRKEIGNSVAITRHLDGCLSVYPERLWEERNTRMQRLNAMLSINKKHRQLSRFLTVGECVDVDASGRMVIPEQFVKFAGLTDSVVFIGTEEGFQLWSAERWETDGMPSIDEVQNLAESDEFQDFMNNTSA